MSFSLVTGSLGAEVLDDKEDTEDRDDDPSDVLVFDFCIGWGFGLDWRH